MGNDKLANKLANFMVSLDSSWEARQASFGNQSMVKGHISPGPDRKARPRPAQTSLPKVLTYLQVRSLAFYASAPYLHIISKVTFRVAWLSVWWVREVEQTEYLT